MSFFIRARSTGGTGGTYSFSCKNEQAVRVRKMHSQVDYMPLVIVYLDQIHLEMIWHNSVKQSTFM